MCVIAFVPACVRASVRACVCVCARARVCSASITFPLHSKTNTIRTFNIVVTYYYTEYVH